MRNANAMEAVVGWMDAMRRGDLAAVAEWFDPQVSWRGVPEDALCRNRDDVLEMLGDSLVPCPEEPERHELEPGLRGAEAVELITADADTVVLGAKVPGLSEIGGEDLGGQIFNVFRVKGGRIVEVADYARRQEALAASRSAGPGMALAAATTSARARSSVIDLVPFIHVSDVARSIRFWKALGFRVVKRYEPNGRLEFAGLESTAAAKVMLARVDRPSERDEDRPTPGFLYLYTPDLAAFRKRLLEHGIEVGEITDGPGPGPNREMCVRDPDGHGHMVAELWRGSIAGRSEPSLAVSRVLAVLTSAIRGARRQRG